MGQFLSNCSVDSLATAAQSLIDGHLVAFPTETVYGLGADATNQSAVARIYEVKGRPADHPLIVHIADLKYLDQWISEIPAYAIELARSFWPGPMTLILNRSELAKDFITGNQDTVGIRIPDNSIALGLLEAFHQKGGTGIAAPSANRFGQVSPTTAAAVEEELSEYLTDSDLVLDGGQSEVGLESTIIDCTTELPRILRPGAITIAMIEEVTGLKISAANISNPSNIRVSGSLENHYAPKAKVILDQEPTPGAGFIALAESQTPPGVVRLAAPNTVEEFARTLYSALRKGDHQNLTTIYIAQPAGDGLAIAIRDRLARSANGR
ncbi:SUA5 Putative translation factor (SUA5) [Candidatus Nanopelagicaceae bacterium]